MTAPRLTIRHLAFTGPGKGAAEIGFREGCNLVWGASNTGKSLTLKAFDFMLGGSRPLPDIGERQGYDTAWFGFTIGDEEFTLSRSVAGGNYLLYEGLFTGPGVDVIGTDLDAKHDHKKSNTLSNFLLTRLGFGGNSSQRTLSAPRTASASVTLPESC
jgi:hypothetical protein